jgi:nucleoside-diphosphate-sugar epimerase
VPGLRFQAVHSDDVAQAYRAAVLSDRSGAFNIAAEPVIGSEELAAMLGARLVRVPPQMVRVVAAATYRARLQPAEPGWVDMGLGVPLMSTERARHELGWTPRRTATETMRELAEGMRDGADDRTAPLARSTSGPARIRELLTGVGGRQ